MFSKYSSIPNYTHDKSLQKTKDKFGHYNFVATEKIHGSNFQFICSLNGKDELKIDCAKRTDLIEGNQGFYNCERILERYRQSLTDLFNAVYQEQDRIQDKINLTISVYGEIFGGNYPGISSPKDSKNVQKGMFYHPDNEFLVFDIKYFDKVSDFNIFLPFTKVIEVLNKLPKYTDSEKQTLKSVPLIYSGDLDSVLKLCQDNITFN